MDRYDPTPGFHITRMDADGAIINISGLHLDTLAKIEMLGKMEDRRKEYVTVGNWQALIELSNEYENKFMYTMAAVIKKEAVEHGAKENISSIPAQPVEDKRGQWGGSRKKKYLHATADGVHAGAASANRRHLPAAGGTRKRSQV